ncbi:MAG: hypothetical protein IIC33_00865 [Chloroflexi bacterium]|nr:hypothetical protein [Chloroflexota bacterium]
MCDTALGSSAGIAIQNVGTAQSRYENMLEHLGMRWGYVFLRAASHLAEDDLMQLMTQAVEMYLQGEDERNVKGSNYDGKLYTERKYELLGEFGGQRFDVEIDTIYGRDKATFLVSEQTKGVGSTISLN